MADEKWPVDDNPWRVKAERTAFENDWFWVEEHDVVRPDGRDGYYGVIRVRRLAVGVLPIDSDGRVHLVGQWRYPLGRYSWEMPEGGADPGESAEACARRELAEETGLRAGRLVEILRMDLSNSLSDEQAVVFLATDLSPGPAAPDGTERLRHRLAPFADALAAVAAGKITDALTVAAVLRAHHMAVKGEIERPLGDMLRG